MRLDVFDEDDPEQHQMKVLFGFGLYFAFRGSTEHSNLRQDQIYQGTFKPGHEFAGQRFVGVKDMVDKTHQLSVHQNYVCDTSGFMQMPVGGVKDTRLNNFGASLVRYLEKLAPAQVFLYTKPLDEARYKVFCAQGFKNVKYKPKMKRGKIPIA